MQSLEKRREYGRKFRSEKRDQYNQYQNEYYHKNSERINEIRRNNRRKKIQEALDMGIINASAYVVHGATPIYRNEED